MTTPTLTDPPAVDRHLLATLQRAFDRHAGGDDRITPEALQRALGLRSTYLARRMLRLFDLNGDGVIRREEFLEGVRQLMVGTPREKLLFAFRLHDEDGNGTIDREEMLRMISLSLSEDQVMTRSGEAERLVEALFARADRNRDGRLSFEEFEAVVQERPGLLDQMTRSEARWISPSEDVLARVSSGQTRAPFSLRRFLQNRWLPAVYVLGWALVNAGVMAAAVFGSHHGRPGHPATLLDQLGRGATTCINLNGALILLPMTRRLLAWARSTWVGRVVPIDSSVTFHRIVGHAMFAFALLHTAAQLVSSATKSPDNFLGKLLTSRMGGTGAALIVVFAVMWVFSLSIVRRSRHFELFYFTHLLYLVWLVLLAIHDPGFLLLAGLPLIAFFAEQVWRRRRRGTSTQVTRSEALRSGVTRIEMVKPAGFVHHAGDYVFLKIPAVARHEWHPYTLSSAPENPALTVHIRALGNWSTAVRRVVESRAPGAPPLVAHLDGPHGTPSAHIFKARHVVLIGAGIGITPFASVLESLVLRENAGGERGHDLRKAHFFWLNRDQYSFEWFSRLLATLETQDRRGLLEVNIFMTGARGGATSVGLEVAREALMATGGPDVVTGLRTRTRSGHPDWEAELTRIAALHRPDPVLVFFCGPPGLAATLAPLCERLGLPFHEERF
jgi:ferredoxin-NADP reductase/Ca2+-binding EF-hand superfamily protein